MEIFLMRDFLQVLDSRVTGVLKGRFHSSIPFSGLNLEKDIVIKFEFKDKVSSLNSKINELKDESQNLKLDEKKLTFDFLVPGCRIKLKFDAKNVFTGGFKAFYIQ